MIPMIFIEKNNKILNIIFLKENKKISEAT